MGINNSKGIKPVVPVEEPVKKELVEPVEPVKPVVPVITKEFVINEYKNDINKKKYDNFMDKFKKHL